VQDADLVERPVEAGNRLGHVEHWRAEGGAGGLVGGQRVIAAAAERLGEQFRVQQGVGDAVRGQRILEVPGVADQRPARAVAAHEHPALAAEAVQAVPRLAARQGVRQPRVELGQDTAEAAADVAAERRLEARCRHGDEHTRRVVVGGDDADAGLGAVDPAIAVAWTAVPVPVDGGRHRRTGTHHLCPGEPGHGGVAAIGTDDAAGAHLVHAAVAVDDRGPGDPTGRVVAQGSDAAPEAEPGPGRGGGVDEHPVEHRAPRGVEGRDAVFVGNRDLEFLAAVDEGRAADRRRVRGDHGRQHAPPVQLHDRAAHQGVGGQGVGAGGAAIDDEHVRALRGESQRGGGAGAAGAGDQDIDGRGP